jgi:hypothetical protein
MYVRRALILTVAIGFVCSAAVMAQRNNDNNRKQPQRPPQEQQDVQALVTLVDTALMTDTGVPVPTPGAQAPTTPITPKPLTFGTADKTDGQIAVKWQSNHFVKGQSGDTYVPFTVSVDKAQVAKGAALYVRIVNAEQAAAFSAAMAASVMPPQQGGKPPAAPTRPTFAWDSVHFIDVPDGGQLSRAVQLKPGQYVAFVAVKEKSPAPAGNQRNDRNRNDRNAPPAAVAGPVGLLRHEITVPDYNVPDLRTSSVIMAQSVEPLTQALPADQQEANPYVFGPMRIVPSLDAKFSKSGELSVIFWIYGAKEAASGKPDVVIDYSFHQRLAEGEKYFNKTAPQPLNAETLPPQFSIAAGHQLPGSLVIPLASFPAGEYRLEIKVTDKPSGNQLTQNVNFTVLPV